MRLKDRIDLFIQAPEVSAWYNATDLKPKTRENYALRLMQILECMNISPAQFLQDCNGNRKQLLTRIKIALGKVTEHMSQP
jgi:hypothetical protein